MEYNQSGPKPKQLQEYLEAKLADEGLLTSAFFQQIIREDVVDAIERMGSIAEVYIEVEKDQLDVFYNSQFAGLLNFAAESAPDNAVLKIGISRARGAREGQAIDKRTLLPWLRPRANTEVPGAKFRARVEEQPDDSGSSIWLDLFSQTYADRIHVRMTANKAIDSEHCYEQIHGIYSRLMNP